MLVGFRFRFLAVLVVVDGAVGGCGADTDPYDALSSDALGYVIPDSSAWSSGRLCPDGGACSGPVTVEVIEHYGWFRITDVAIQGDDSTEGSVQIQLSVTDARPSDPGVDDAVELRAWGPDIDEVEEVLSSDFDVWVGADPDNASARVFVAVDPEGRLAAIGTAAAEYFTIPVANLAADADATSGFALLDPLMLQ